MWVLHSLPFVWLRSSSQAAGLPDCPDIAKCMNCMLLHGNDTCWAVRKPVLYRLKSYGKLPNASDPLVMMNEIRQRGPITCSMAPPPTFTFGYRGGIVTGSDYPPSEIVGWGEEPVTGTPFWRIRNSWGTFWGELGAGAWQKCPANRVWRRWVAEPDFGVEEDVLSGRLHGSMYGLVKRGLTSTSRSAAQFVAQTAQFGMQQLHGAAHLLHVVGTVVSGEVLD